LDHFDDKVAFVLYYENEEEANHHLLDIHLLEKLKSGRVFSLAHMRHMVNYNASVPVEHIQELTYDSLFDRMVAEEWMRIAVIIAGQGPEAYGMPEMMTPMQHINAHRQVARLATLISD